MSSVFEELSNIQQAFAGAASIASLLVDRQAGEDPGGIVVRRVATGTEFVLPGLVQRIWVGGQKHDFEGVPIEGRSGNLKLYHGVTDAEIYVELYLFDDDETTWGEDISQWLTLNFGDAYRRTKELIEGKAETLTALEKLETINVIYHMRDLPDMTPSVFEVSNPHINARLGSDAKVLFGELVSETLAGKSIVRVNIKFVEHVPAAAMLEV